MGQQKDGEEKQKATNKQFVQCSDEEACVK